MIPSLGRTLLFLSALAGVPAVQAQSSVRMYGLNDIGILVNSRSPSERLTALNSNGMNGNRLGFSGRENLGGGMAAVFTLETGWDGSTGAHGFGGRLFGSQALVGLESRYGSLLGGRQVNVDVWTTGLLTAQSQWAGLAGAHVGDNDNYYNAFRVPNSLKYISPRVDGFQIQALYGFGEHAGSTQRGRVAAAGVTYEKGPWRLAASVSNSRNPNLGLAAGTGATGVPVVPTNNFFSSPILSGYASARTWNVMGVGVNYTVGDASFGYVHSNSQFRNLGDLNSGPNPVGYSGTAEFRNHQFHVKYNISPAWQVGVQYVITNRNSVSTAAQPDGSGDAKYRHFAVAVRYYLAKNVFLYAVVGDQRASGTGSTGGPAVAHIIGGVASAGSHQRHYRIGLQHRF